MNYAKASLVIEIAGKALHADVGPEYGMDKHAVIPDGNAFTWEIAC
jgi:hypothetical protein